MEELSHFSDKGKRDFALVQRAVKGDQAAFSEIMKIYYDAVNYSMLKMVRTDEDAEDLTIEAFGKAFNKIHTYEPTFAFSTWLFRIATNNAIDFLRKKRAPTVSYDHGYQNDDEENHKTLDFDSGDRNPEEEIINNQKIKRMRDLVSRLKPRYRTLIEMRYFDELAYEEIAQELNLPLGTVKAQLFRAKALLNTLITESNEPI